MASKILDYEEVRRRKLEENKKKLDELNLSHLALSLRESTGPKTPPAKQVKRKAPREEFTVVKRRSNRIANLPEQGYSEVPELVYLSAKSSGRTSKYRDLDSRVYASDEARAFAIEKAEELEAGLGELYPTFVRPMLQSHTTGGFWLGLPNHFCKKHLPKKDESIYLIDEDGDETRTLYLAVKKGLSAGWRGFAIDHKLVDGDALVFQLINPNTFKVYIIRQCSYSSD